MRALVDIGSNSVKFAVAEMHQGLPKVVESGSWITRLGAGLAKSGGRLSPESVAASEKAFEEMRARLRAYPGVALKVVATSAVRDCVNPEEIATRVKKVFNVELRILSGLEEARLSFEGAKLTAQQIFPDEPVLFVDVGGASTEVGIPPHGMHSFNAGAVRCHENLGWGREAIADSAWVEGQKKISAFFDPAELKRISHSAKARVAIGIGGSLVVSAQASGAQARYDASGKSLAYFWTREALKKFNEELRVLSAEERSERYKIEAGRADVACAALLCLSSVLDFFSVDEIAVTTWGLRHGALVNFDEI